VVGSVFLSISDAIEETDDVYHVASLIQSIFVPEKKLQKTEEAIDNSETLEAMEKNHTHRKLKRQETQIQWSFMISFKLCIL
jgi:hypothetical protein